jgi:hypothetical protein
MTKVQDTDFCDRGLKNTSRNMSSVSVSMWIMQKMDALFHTNLTEKRHFQPKPPALGDFL